MGMCIGQNEQMYAKASHTRLEIFHPTLDLDCYDFGMTLTSRRVSTRSISLLEAPASQNNDNKQTPITTMENYMEGNEIFHFGVEDDFSTFTHIAFHPARPLPSFCPTTIEFHILPFFFLRFSFAFSFYTSPIFSPRLTVHIHSSVLTRIWCVRLSICSKTCP